MQSARWNVTRLAIWGAVAGVLYGLARAFINMPSPPMEYLVGTVIGGAVAGAVLFGVVALIRNWAVRARQ